MCISLRSRSKAWARKLRADATRILKFDPPSCICDVSKPVIVLAQWIGIFPVTLIREGCLKRTGMSLLQILSTVHRKVPNPAETGAIHGFCSSHDCSLNYSRGSWPSVSNFMHILTYLAALIWVHTNLLGIMKIYFHGTDLYALYFQVFTIYYEVLSIILFTRWKSSSIISAWMKLIEVFGLLKRNYRCPPLKRIKYLMWGLLAVVGVTTFSYSQGIIFLILRRCLLAKRMEDGPSCSILTGYFWQKAVHSLLVLFYQSFSVLFLMFSLIIRLLNKEICLWLRHEMNKSAVNAVAVNIAHIRRVHCKLSSAILSVSDFFGLQALIVTCSIIISLALNIFKLILTGPLASQPATAQALSFMWISHLYFGTFTVALTLMAGQLVKNLVMHSS